MERSPKTPLALLILAALTLTATFLLALTGPGSLTEVSVPPPTVSASLQNQTGPWYAIYFTDRTLDGFSGGPDEPLVEAIEAAQLSVDVAAYDLSLWSVRDALLHAHDRGLSVRVVLEADNADREEVQQLIAAGIPVVVDTSEDGWMHDKFVILDRQGVWTGSMNFTLNDGYRNDNNLIWLGSAEVAEVYRAEFEEMFGGGLFGAESPREVGGRSFTVSGSNVEVWFSPDDGVSARIVELINAAEVSIHFLAFSFTSNDIADAILARAEAGVLVQGVFDEGQLENPGGEFARMLTEGLDVRLDANPDKLHHKFIVIDGRVVITGSYNFSVSAEVRNDENVVVIFSEEVARVYLEEVQRVVGEAGE
ncbi:MAG: phospholipase [Anaerolineales bacterium]|nr:phospholipase [Anaerolineales bacterium]